MDQAGAKVVVPSLYISYTLSVSVAQWFSTLAVPENYGEDFFKKQRDFCGLLLSIWFSWSWSGGEVPRPIYFHDMEDWEELIYLLAQNPPVFRGKGNKLSPREDSGGSSLRWWLRTPVRMYSWSVSWVRGGRNIRLRDLRKVIPIKRSAGSTQSGPGTQLEASPHGLMFGKQYGQRGAR